MSQGYPSKHRARKAFERGVDTGFRKRAGRCPYRNARLAELWERGRQMGLGGRRPRVEPEAHHPARREHPARRPFAPPARHHAHGTFRRDPWGGRR